MVDDVSAAVSGSEELGRTLVREFGTQGLRVHYCSAAFKDGIQLRRRLERRAQNVAKPYELETEDQTLLKGVVECDDPGALARDLMATFDVPRKGVSELYHGNDSRNPCVPNSISLA